MGNLKFVIWNLYLVGVGLGKFDLLFLGDFLRQEEGHKEGLNL